MELFRFRNLGFVDFGCLSREKLWKHLLFLLYFFKKSEGWFNLMSLFLTLNYFSGKNIRRSTVSMTYFESSFCFVHAYELWPSEIFCKKCCSCLKMLTNCYIILQLWASFVTKHIKRPTIFTTYSQSSGQITVTYSQGSRYLQTASRQEWCIIFQVFNF